MKLEFINGPQSGKIIELTPPLTKIGREVDNDISILSGGLSRYHAKFLFNNEKWFLEDLNSTNGSFINKKRLLPNVPEEIQFDDVLTFSDQVIKIKSENEGNIVATHSINQVQFNITPDAVAGPILNLIPTDPASQPPPTPVQIAPKVFVPEPPPAPVAIQPLNETPSAPIIDLSKISSDALFAGADRTLKIEDTSNNEVVHKEKFNTKIMNLVILLIGIIGIIVVVGIIMNIDRTAKEKVYNPAQPILAVNPGVPLTMHFERQKEINGNLFRFEFRVEFGKQVRVRLFDVKSNVLFDSGFKNLVLTVESNGKTTQLDGVTLHALELKDLVRRIKESGIFETEENVLANKGNDYYYINICSGLQSKELFEYSNAPPRSIELVEEAVSAFSLTVLKLAFTRPFEELLEESERMFRIAEDRYNNSEGADGNLKDAIKNLKYVISSLQIFEPKPPTYKLAEELLINATTKRDRKVSDLRFAAESSFNLKEYGRALELQNRILNFLDKDDDSDMYSKTERNINLIQSKLQNQISGGNR